MMLISNMCCCIVKMAKHEKKFVFNDGFVFRANKLYIPASSIRLLLLQEAHVGGKM
jgi:hypothetical protein